MARCRRNITTTCRRTPRTAWARRRCPRTSAPTACALQSRSRRCMEHTWAAAAQEGDQAAHKTGCLTCRQRRIKVSDNQSRAAQQRVLAQPGAKKCRRLFLLLPFISFIIVAVQSQWRCKQSVFALRSRIRAGLLRFHASLPTVASEPAERPSEDKRNGDPPISCLHSCPRPDLHHFIHSPFTHIRIHLHLHSYSLYLISCQHSWSPSSLTRSFCPPASATKPNPPVAIVKKASASVSVTTPSSNLKVEHLARPVSSQAHDHPPPPPRLRSPLLLLSITTQVHSRLIQHLSTPSFPLRLPSPIPPSITLHPWTRPFPVATPLPPCLRLISPRCYSLSDQVCQFARTTFHPSGPLTCGWETSQTYYYRPTLCAERCTTPNFRSVNLLPHHLPQCNRK